MRKIAISLACAAALASCTTTPEDTAAAVKQACNAAEVTAAAIDPWAEAGRLSEKNTRIFNAAKETLFDKEEGVCVVAPTGNLSALLVRVSSVALNISLVLKDANKGS